MSNNNNRYNKMYKPTTNKPEDKTSLSPDEIVEEASAVIEPESSDVVEETPAAVEPENTNAVKESATYGVITAALLNVRERPDVSSEPICVLAKDTKIKLVLSKSTDEWYGVVIDDATVGYSMKKFIKIC